MSEQTIDELIAQTDDYYRDPEQYMSRVYLEAIRAILEQHRGIPMPERIQLITCPFCGKHHQRFFVEHAIGLEAIRAFVERVQVRHRLPSNSVCVNALKAELAAMEKEITK